MRVFHILSRAYRKHGSEFVTELYNELLNRSPDPSGLNTHLNSLSSGCAKSTVLESIVLSEEFSSLLSFSKPTEWESDVKAIRILQDLFRRDGQEFVSELYRELLNREPDGEGLRNNLNLLTDGITKMAMLKNILFSSEGQAMLSIPFFGMDGMSHLSAGHARKKGFVSIIIPTYNGVHLTKQCVDTLKRTVDTHYEIIVVDDGSPAHVQSSLQTWANQSDVKLVMHSRNAGFSHTVNTGIQMATGEYVLLLNNDIVFHESGWLEKLIETMNAAQNIGIVGARLLYPDGRIQHAGSYPMADGWFEHFHRFQPHDYPEAQWTADVPALTGALLLVRRDVFDEVGALSEDYFIAFEDVDLCYRAKQRGWRTVYCGTACAVHLEGQTRTNSEINKDQFYTVKQLEAKEVFHTKWNSQNPSPFQHIPVIYVLERTRMSGGIKNVLEQINRLHDLGYQVQLFSLEDEPTWFPLRGDFTKFSTYGEILAQLKHMKSIKLATSENTLSIVLDSCNTDSGGCGIALYLVQDIQESDYPNTTHMQSLCSVVPAHLLTTTDWTSKKLRQKFMRESTNISIAIDREIFKPNRTSDYDPLRILTCSSGYQHSKGFHLTTAAVDVLHRELPGASIVTFGIERPDISGIAHSHFTHPDDQTTAYLYANCGVFVQTSIHEGFTLPVLEAMACGAPVVTTKAEGNEEFCIDGENCVLVDKGDIAGIADGIRRVLTDRDFANHLSVHGQVTARKYNWPTVLFNLNNVFCRVLSSN